MLYLFDTLLKMIKQLSIIYETDSVRKKIKNALE